MNKVNIFCSETTAVHRSMTQRACNLFSAFFSPPSYVTFVFCHTFVGFSDGYRSSGRHPHESSPHSAKKKNKTKLTKCVCQGGVECRVLTMKYWEHHYVVAVIDVLLCFCCARLGGFQKEWLTIRGITLQPNTWQPDQKWPCLFWVMSASFASAQTKQQEGQWAGQSLLSVRLSTFYSDVVTDVCSVHVTFSSLWFRLSKASILRNRSARLVEFWYSECLF